MMYLLTKKPKEVSELSKDSKSLESELGSETGQNGIGRSVDLDVIETWV